MKNKLLKINIPVMLSMVLALTTTSCDDLLEKAPITELDATKAIQTEDDHIALVNGAYDPLQWQVINGAQTHMYPVMWQDIRADNFISQWASFWTFGAVLDDLSTIEPSNSNVTALWQKWYTAISRANNAIKFINEFEGFSSEELKARLIAESKFIRAFAYFELVKMWGDVPLIVKAFESAEDDLKLPRSPKADVYEQIQEDLEAAIVDLPLKGEYDASELGRATKGAAYTLLAKANLYQENYSKVVEYTEEVMQLGYSLEANFADNFNVDNEHGVESIFEIGYVDGFSNIQFESPAATTNQGSSSHQMFGYLFNIPVGNSAFGNAVPRQSLIDFFDDTDARKDASFITPNSTIDGNPLSCFCLLGFDENGQPIFDEDKALPYASTDTYYFFWTRPEALESRATNRKTALLPSTHSNLLNFGSSPLNEKVFRYADVLLMHAEASAQGGGGDGQSSLDAVRQRAGLTSIPLTLQNVKDERRRELAGEGWDRFTDLVRWGDAATVLAFKNFTTGRDEYLPIPQSEIDLVGPDILKQNDGY